MKCTNCGYDLPEEGNFCENCGAKIERPEEPAAEPVVEPAAEPAAEPVAEPAPAPAPAAQKNSTSLL